MGVRGARGKERGKEKVGVQGKGVKVCREVVRVDIQNVGGMRVGVGFG